VHDLELHVCRQTHRKPIQVDLVNVAPLRLEINLVALTLREPHDLVFERWAVARPDTLNLPVEQWRLVDVCQDDVAHAIVGVRQIARCLRDRNRLGEK
jgi:hypothetical protein